MMWLWSGGWKEKGCGEVMRSGEGGVVNFL